MKEGSKKYLSQPLRVECGESVQLITTRSISSRLWFVNNKELEERVYAFLAKYVEQYEVELFNFQLVGNHYHILARFPQKNMAHFCRDLNARIAESVRLLVPEFESGPVFHRRYSNQVIPNPEDIQDYFFYIALQSVSSGLCARISEYPGRTFFNDAVNGKEREYKYFSHGEYYQARLRKKKVDKSLFWRRYTLRFKRLPGHADEPLKEYQAKMTYELESRRQKVIKKLTKEKPNLRFRTKGELRRVKAGSKPKRSKQGGKRPLVLSRCMETKAKFIKLYRTLVEQFKIACSKYRSGDFTTIFPPGTYKPSGLCIRGI